MTLVQFTVSLIRALVLLVFVDKLLAVLHELFVELMRHFGVFSHWMFLLGFVFFNRLSGLN